MGTLYKDSSRGIYQDTEGFVEGVRFRVWRNMGGETTPTPRYGSLVSSFGKT